MNLREFLRRRQERRDNQTPQARTLRWLAIAQEIDLRHEWERAMRQTVRFIPLGWKPPLEQVIRELCQMAGTGQWSRP